jgi:hypothetical protein
MGGKLQRHEIFPETRHFHAGSMYPLYIPLDVSSSPNSGGSIC